MKYKSIVLQFIVILGLVFFGTENVSAYHKDTLKDVEQGSAILLCEYAAENSKDGIQVFYHIGNTEYKADFMKNGWWDVFYKTGDSWSNIISAWTQENLSFGSFQDVFYGSRIHYNEEGKYMSNVDNFYCPKYGFIDTDANNELCLGDNKSCGDKFDRERENLSTTAPTIFNDINKYAEETVYSEISASDLLSNELLSIIKNKTKTYVKNKYFTGSYIYPTFIDNYINKLETHIDATNTEEYKNFQKKISEETDEAVQKELFTEEEAKVIKERVAKSLAETLGIKVNVKEPISDASCNAILTPTFSKVIQNILTFIQYLGPVLVAVFTIIDLFKAALSGEQDDMKKVTRNFSKRIIAAILLFFVPLLVNIIFSLTGIVAPSTCFQ